MRAIYDGANGGDGREICRLWGAGAKPTDVSGTGANGMGRGPAGTERPTRGRRIGPNSFVIPAHNTRYAPVVAAFSPKGTRVPDPNLRRFGAQPGAMPLTGEDAGSLPKPRSCGCGCGGKARKNGRG